MNLKSQALMGLFVLLTLPVMAQVRIDGRIDAAEWAQAQHVTDFRLVQPLSGAPSPYPTEAWILATPEGLAIAFHSTQAATVPRMRQHIQRDQDAQVDRVNLMVDFDGDGGTAYDFMITISDGIADAVITNENNFSKDWDGIWEHAVSEDAEGWSAEMRVPWHTAPIKRGHAGQRILAIYLDRVVGSTGERMAWPTASFRQPRFISDFSKVTVSEFNQALFAITPYLVGMTDRISGDSQFDAGADLYWKPGGHFQLTGTLNPDFGQVESDELVVNFDAVETFFSDKRPFFTENQGLFNIGFGSKNSNLIYTRRVGGPADDGTGAGDVTAAVKFNSSLGTTDYGVLAASEADAAGRDFYALRVTHDMGTQDIGMLVTQVNRPFLDREATVYALDHHWKPNQSWNIVSQFVMSDISQLGTTSKDSGAQVLIDNDRGNGWRQQLYALHLGADLQLNDFGYLDRNSFNYLRYEIKHRVTDLPESSRYRSHDNGFTTSMRYNDHGERLFGALKISQYSEFRKGGDEYFEIVALGSGVDDLTMRGNGNLWHHAKLYAFYERNSPRRGRWSVALDGQLDQSGLAGINQSDISMGVEPTFYVNDSLNVFAALHADYHPDWLLWQKENLLGTFHAEVLRFSAGLRWSLGSRQELRIKLEALALNAKNKAAWRVGDDGHAKLSNDVIDDFNLQNIGFQVRYRYELAPLSDLFVVYSRGGYGYEENGTRELGELFGDAFSLRDSEQLLIKLSYRFAN